MTIWKSINGFDGYEVSSDGEVRSWRPVRNNAKPPVVPRILKSAMDGNGYRIVCLYSINGKRTIKISTLVAESFYGPRPYNMCVRHLNGKQTDDRLSNLKWGTYLENSDDAIRHGTWLHGEPVHTSKLKEADVIAILNSPLTPLQLARKYGVTNGNICHILKGRSWKHLTGLRYIKP